MSSVRLCELFGLFSNFNPLTTEGLKELKEYQFLVEQSAQAGLAFLNQDLAKFDPNIGDCACQIRSVKTVLLARDGKVRAEMEKLVDQAARVQEACSGRLAAKKAQIEVAEVALNVSRDVAYLIQAYIFTLTHNIVPPSEDKPLYVNGKIVPSQLSDLSEDRMTKTRAVKISSIIRRHLSLASLEFIRQEAESSQNPVYIRACSEAFTQNFDTIFFSVPMFYSYHTLMETCRRETIPILFKVKVYDKDLPIAERQIGTEYIRLGSMACQDSPFCVFEGVRQDSRENLQKLRVLCNNTLARVGQKVILAGAADHPQYAKEATIRNIEELENEVEESLRLDQFAARARAVGCSLSNPSLFFIQHVYPQSEKFLLKEGCPATVLGIREEGVIDV